MMIRSACSSLLLARRFIRTRTGSYAAIESAKVEEKGDAPFTNRRPPPASMSMDYITRALSGPQGGGSHGGAAAALDAGTQTEPAVWRAATVREAWETLYQCMLESAAAGDDARLGLLRQRDMAALGRCTAHAELLHLLSLFPPEIRRAITGHAGFVAGEVEEVFLHLGQHVEVRGGAWAFQLPAPRVDDLKHVLRAVGHFGEDGRGCVRGTAHRVSAWRGREGEVLGVTVRVGRFVPGAAEALLPLALRGNLLILSRAGMGKTTLLRDLAASLAHRTAAMPRVTVVDTSNEIGGDGALPLPFLGRCRRIQVRARHCLSEVMTEVIQNHSPEYLVVDEIATAAEAQAAWSISQRGARLIATCHGEHLEGLLQNQALNLLVGGAAHAFLSNEERRMRQKTKKTVLERPQASPFQTVVEITERGSAFVYVDVNTAVDLLLDERTCKNNPAVGGYVRLAEPLPEKLLRKSTLMREAPSSASPSSRHNNSNSNNKGDAEYRETVDRDGYTVRQPRKQQQQQHGSLRQRTEEEIYKDLSSLL